MTNITRSLLIATAVVVASVAHGNLKPRFELVAPDAPVIVVAKYAIVGDRDRGEARPVLQLVQVLRGNVAETQLEIRQPYWLSTALEEQHLYVVLLASDLRPYVGPVGSGPEDEPFPLFADVGVNVLEVIDGYLYDPVYEYFITDANSDRVPYAKLAEWLEQLIREAG